MAEKKARTRKLARHLVVLCHPSTKSFNAEVARTYREMVRTLGQNAIIRDLYRLNFDPILKDSERPTSGPFTPSPDVAAELRAIRSADVLVLVYPIWYGAPPAMMKGYIDRVLGAGVNYQAVRVGRGAPALRGKHLLSITTSGNTIQWLDLKGAWLSLRTLVDRYLAEAFGFSSVEHLHLSGIGQDLDHQSALQKLRCVTETATETCALLRATTAPGPRG